MLKNVLYIVFLIAFPFSIAKADEPVFDRVMKTKTINCGYFVWPPFTVKDINTNKFSGINVEIMEAVARNLGLKVNWAAEVGIGDTVSALNANKVDAICSTMWPSPQRTANMTLTNAEFFDEFYAVVRKGDSRFDNDIKKADIEKVSIVGIDNDVTMDVAIEKLPQAKKIVLPQSATAADALMYLITKKADIVFIDQSTVDEFSRNNPGKLKLVQGIAPIRTSGEHIYMKEGEYHLRDMFNIALTQLTNDGIIEEITQRYSKEYKSNFMPPLRNFQKQTK